MSTLARFSTALAALISVTAISSSAFAGDKYYVYKKKGTSECEITMRDQDEFKKARGSSWEFVGDSTTRSGASKIADEAGCTST